ncbi:MAG: arginase family protein [Porticoccus sp.]
MRRLTTIGIASGIAGNHIGCEQGPVVLKASTWLEAAVKEQGFVLDWLPMLTAIPDLTTTDAVSELCARASVLSQNFTQQKKPFIFLGGDHSNAMGIWQGAMSALLPKKLGLIWIDAHMDAHTFVTSPSGNIHGMPIAGLLGQADPKLRAVYGDGPFLTPECLALLGVRSFEKAEHALLQRLNILHIPMVQITTQNNLSDALNKSVKHVLKQASYFAFSIDLDAIDPQDAPAVSMPEPEGISGAALCAALYQFNNDPRCLGLEIAEYSPEFDKKNKTQHLIAGLIGALYGVSRTPNKSFGSAGDGIKSTS